MKFILFLVLIVSLLYSQDYSEDNEYFSNFQVHPITKEIILYNPIKLGSIKGVWLKRPDIEDGIFQIDNVFFQNRYKTYVKATYKNNDKPKKIFWYNQDNKEVQKYEITYTDKNNIELFRRDDRGYLFDNIRKMKISYNDDETKIRKIEYFSSDSKIVYISFYMHYKNEIKIVMVNVTFDVTQIVVYQIFNKYWLQKIKKYELGEYHYYRDSSKIITLFFDNMISFDNYNKIVNYGSEKYEVVDLYSKEDVLKVVSHYENGFLMEKVFLKKQIFKKNNNFISRFNYIHEGEWSDFNQIKYEYGTKNAYTEINVVDGWVQNNTLYFFDEIKNEKLIAEKKYQYYPNGRLFTSFLYVNNKPVKIDTYNILEDYRIEQE